MKLGKRWNKKAVYIPQHFLSPAEMGEWSPVEGGSRFGIRHERYREGKPIQGFALESWLTEQETLGKPLPDHFKVIASGRGAISLEDLRATT